MELILPDLMVAHGLYSAQVCELVPYPDASRLLLVMTASIEELDRARALAAELGGGLRAELAQAIHRRRAPDLVLEVWAAPQTDLEVGDD